MVQCLSGIIAFTNSDFYSSILLPRLYRFINNGINPDYGNLAKKHAMFESGRGLYLLPEMNSIRLLCTFIVALKIIKKKLSVHRSTEQYKTV